jgi:hypothetical protein
MIDITPEKVLKFREKLHEEMVGPQLWYHPTKESSKDIVVFRPECPYSHGKKGTISEQRYLWWLHHPEDPIEYNEMIHHINGNHKDNRIENLEKVKMKQHMQRHKQMRDSHIAEMDISKKQENP